MCVYYVPLLLKYKRESTPAYLGQKTRVRELMIYCCLAYIVPCTFYAVCSPFFIKKKIVRLFVF